MTDADALAMKHALKRMFDETSTPKTQQKIADDSGLSVNNIKDWMAGRREPRMRHFFAFGAALGYSRAEAFAVLQKVVLEES